LRVDRDNSTNDKQEAYSACQIVLDETQDTTTLWERIYVCISAGQLQEAVGTVGELTRALDDSYTRVLLGRYLMTSMRTALREIILLSVAPDQRKASLP
jgi:hypothetical protein